MKIARGLNMGNKNMSKIFVLAALLVALAFQASALPDNPPTCSLSTNTAGPTTTAVLTAVSVDTLANPGVESIKIYDNGALLDTKSCGYPTTCVFSKTVTSSVSGTHTYYAVCRDAAGQQTTSQSVSVQFQGTNQAPIIDSSSPASPLTIDEDKTVNFQVAAHDPNNDALSYSWSVDGTTVQNSGTSYAFQRNVDSPKTFTVVVYVTDGKGGYAVKAWQVTVNDINGRVSIGTVTGTTECDTFEFKADTDSYDGFVSCTWNFGDGSSGSGNIVTHQYAENGSYPVSVICYEADGDNDSDARTLTVSDISPSVDAGADKTVAEGDVVQFTGTATMPCPADTIQNYTWNFGDGSPLASGASLTQTTHNYTIDGAYTVTLTVCDEDSCASDTLLVTATDAVPKANFTYVPASPIEGEAINFTDTSKSYDAIVSWEWDFDNNGVADATTQNASFTFGKEGDYTVCLTVTDVDGDKDKACKTVHIGNNMPVVTLVATPTSGNEPLTVAFNCTTTGGNLPFTYAIEFGEGSPVTTQSASHTYVQNGTYTAKCTVMDSDGDIASDAENITVGNTVPALTLSLNATSGTEPLTVQANCTAPGTMNIYTISFGTGPTFMASSATYTYMQNGTYTVNCTVEDQDGDKDTKTATVTVADSAPTASFTWSPATPQKGQNVSFNATISAYDLPATIAWDFGDGNKSSVEDPIHAFGTSGDYNVTLTVKDADGSNVTVQHTIHVSNNPPQVDIYVDPLSGQEPLKVNVTCIAIAGVAPLSYELNFGDGSPLALTNKTTHTYLQNGTYNVTCTVTDANLDKGVDSEILTVSDTAPAVNFTFTPLSPAEGQAVDFDATITSHDAIAKIAWNFGDNSTNSTVEDPTHTFLNSGNYTVTVTVTDSDGSTASASRNISVGLNAPTVSLIANSTIGTEPLTVSFGCVATGGNTPYNYTMNFGDGSNASTTATSTHTYKQNGTYTAICTVVDADGDASTDFEVITVQDTKPVVSFTYQPTNPVEGQNVSFNGTVSAYDSPVSIVWDFGDGSTSTQEDPLHAYILANSYNVTLTATDADGSVTVASQVVVVGNNKPLVNLLANPLSGPENMNVSFNCTVAGGNAPLNFVMNYGDNSTGTSQASNHTYTAPGSYTATCTVTDGDGDTDSDFVIINVANNAPKVNLTAVPTTGPEGVKVDFDCNVTGGDAPLGIVLDFGDGTTTTSAKASHNYTLQNTYTARCNVTDADGDMGSDSEVITVTNNAPVANLVLNATSGFEPLSINYTCNVGGGNAPFTFVVDFGDGSATSSSDKGNHTYATPGNYTVTCTVVDVDGDSDQDWVDVRVNNNAPVVDLQYTYAGALTEGVTVNFVCNATNGNAPLAYVLDFGDGTTTTASSASHNYTIAGSYNATCTVTDADSDVGSDKELLVISNNAPVVSLALNATSGYEPLSINYTCTVGNGNAPFTYTVNFGDGSATSSSATGSHNYPTPGNYTVNCSVTDVDSDSAFNTQKVEVFNNAPVVDLQYTYSGSLTEGVTVNFVCNVTGGNAPLAYVLDFGDGSSVAASSASHNYTLAASYNATCTVTDADSDVGSDSALLVITNNAPIVNLALNTTSGFEPLSINYTCTVGNGNAPFTYTVNFGDGSAIISSPTGSHNYPTPGNYTVNCSVTDVDGDSGYNAQKVEVINNPPVASLTAVPSTGPEGMTVDFNCSATAGNAPLSYSLNFGDGTSTTAQVAKHNYTIEAVYNATCTVSDADGDVSTDSKTINVTNNAPVVSLAHNVSVSGIGNVEPRTVGFVCSVGNGNAPFTYSLNFGDGSAPVLTSTASHTYTQNGTYVANCTVTDADSDVSSGTQTVIVVDSEPVTNFTYLPSSPIEGNNIQFTDATTAYDGVVSWAWNFGDGNTSTLQNPTHTYYLQNTYIVTLTTRDADGSETSMVKSVAVGNNVPNVSVSVLPLSGTEPLTVAVSCSATGGNAPLTYSVLYGDGQSTTAAASTHIYNQSGSYPVVCQVTDNDADIGFDMKSVVVNDTKPTADFSWSPANPSAGQTVNFTDLSTGYDAITAWAWDFDNNGVVDATTKNASRVFASPGLYIVNLTVTDSDGSSAWIVKSVAVNISIPSPLIFSVLTTGITNVSANATWATDQAANSRVDYGTTTSLGSMVSDASLVFSHNLMMSGLSPNTTYYYNVTSCNIYSACTTSGPYSFTTLVTTIPDTTPPGPATSLNETGVGTNWIRWAWTNPSDSDFNHVEIWVNGSFVANTSGANYNVTGLSANTTYQVEVVTVDNTGNRNSPGATDLATTLPSVVPDTTPPGPVTGLNETSAGTSWIVWGWVNPSDLDFNHVELWRNGTFVANTSGASYNVTGLSANTTYQIEVVTVDNTGNRNSPGVTDSATTQASVLPDTTPPGPVTGLNESGGVGTSWIAWSWTNPSDADFNHVELWLNGTFITNTSANNYNATGLSANTTYQITVITVDNTGNRNTPGVSDSATTAVPANSVPVVLISATPTSGVVPLQVQFNSTVAGGDAPLSYAWDFNSDGTTDSVLQNPIYIYNAVGTYTAKLNVTDSNGDWDSETINVTASAVTHDIAVNFLNYTKENRTIYLYDAVQVNASVTNQGTVSETFTVQLQVDTSVVDTKNVTLAAGATTTVSMNWASATPKDFHTVLVRALPVTGEVDLSDQSTSKLLRAWSVNDIVDNSTRYVVYWAGTAYVPVLNAYVERTFYDLNVRLSSTTALITPPATQSITLNPSETKILMWTVAALPGDVLTVTEGNNELIFSNTV